MLQAPLLGIKGDFQPCTGLPPQTGSLYGPPYYICNSKYQQTLREILGSNAIDHRQACFHTAQVWKRTAACLCAWYISRSSRSPLGCFLYYLWASKSKISKVTWGWLQPTTTWNYRCVMEGCGARAPWMLEGLSQLGPCSKIMKASLCSASHPCAATCEQLLHWTVPDLCPLFIISFH